MLEKIFSPAENTAPASAPANVGATQGAMPTGAAPKPVSPQKPTAVAPKIQIPRSISINKAAKADEVADVSVTPLITRKKTFTELQLRGLWKDFTKTIPEQVHLATTMQTNIPLLKADNLFMVTVNNSFQEKEIYEFRGQLMSFLADGLENDLIEMQIVVDETQEINKVMLPKDIFNELAENNENFKKFVSEFGLEIL